ncbi:ATP-binding response regulator [Sphingobium fuliginis]|nr:hybrid sensor histidine kinase/response regulator [Sphingobium fuliginis]
MQRELVELHARITLRMPLIQAFFVLSSALLLLPEVPTWKFLLWACAVGAIESGRALYAARLLRRLPNVVLGRTLRIQTVLAFLAGAHAGAMAPLFTHDLSLQNQVFLTFFLVALPAIGVAVSISSRVIAGVYAAAVLLPTSAVWISMHPAHILTSPVASGTYLLVLVFAASENERLLARSVAIRRERDQVVLDLERSNAEVRTAVQRAEAAALARTRVLAAASHDLRQPLHALSVYSAVLAAQPNPATLAEVAGHIDQLVRSLGSLLHGLLDLSQLSSGHYAATRQQFALHEMLDGTCTEFSEGLSRKGLTLTRDLEPTTLDGDAMALQRIARNLIDNAVKYTDRGGVTVRLRHEGSVAVITVQDTGKGIDAAEHERIFEEFYQLSNSGRDRSLGVGLGLAIVDRLTQLAGATIRVHSRVGIGSCFEVRVPGIAAPSSTVPHRAVTDRALRLPAGGRATVYLVDDEAPIVLGMRTLLQAWGLDVHAAQDVAGTTALFSARGRPDLMMADLRLRGQERGVALVARLHALHGEFPVIFVTGETAADALQEVHAAGWPLLHKPVNAESLHDAVGRALAAEEPAR